MAHQEREMSVKHTAYESNRPRKKRDIQVLRDRAADGIKAKKVLIR